MPTTPETAFFRIASDDLPSSAALRLSFACECGLPGCGERVVLTVPELHAPARVVAPGHG